MPFPTGPAAVLPTASPPTSRIVELDALRALAAINLMLFHFTHVYSVKYGYSEPLGFEFPWGKYGVQLFFMLSGFVNAMTLLKKRDATQFLVNRFLRILPIFYVVVLLNVGLHCLAPVNQGSPMTLTTVLANLTLVPNLLGFECLEPVTWTLQIEILFYGWFALMFLSGGLQNPLRTSLGLLVLAGVGGGLVPPPTGLDESRTAAQWLRELLLFEYLPLFVVGMLLQQIRFGQGSRLGNGFGIVLAAIVFHLIDHHDHNPVMTVLLVGLLGLSSFGKLPVLRIKPLVFISTISYSLYLLHDNLGCFLIYHANQAGVPPLVCFLSSFPIVIGLSFLSTRHLERPLSRALSAAWQRLRSRLSSRSVDNSLSLKPISTRT